MTTSADRSGDGDAVRDRCANAFEAVLEWWAEELRIAQEGTRPGEHMANVAGIMMFQVAALAHAITAHTMDGLALRAVALALVCEIERLSGGQCLPTRAEVGELKAAQSVAVH